MLFLKVNDTGLSVSAPDAIEQVVRLATGQVTEADFATWLRSSCVDATLRG